MLEKWNRKLDIWKPGMLRLDTLSWNWDLVSELGAWNLED